MLTVFVDLVVAVNVGVVLASLLFMRPHGRDRCASNSRSFDDDSGEDVKLPKSVLVYRVEGPFFFGAAEKLESTLERVQLGRRDRGDPARARALHGCDAASTR